MKLKERISCLWPLFHFGLKIREYVRGEGIIRVLIYHHVAPSDMSYFSEQIEVLQKNYNIINFKEFSRMYSGEVKVNGINVLITFDDGFYSSRKVCEQVLDPRGIKAVFFVLPDLILAKNKKEAIAIINKGIFDGQPPADANSLDYMRATDIEFLLKMGHTIGSHTRRHKRLSSGLSEAELIDEIIRSGDQLERLFKINIDCFAYPFGDAMSINQQALQLALQRYRYVFSGVRGSNLVTAHQRRCLLRDEISPTYSTSLTRLIVEGGLTMRYRRARNVLSQMEE